MADLLSTRSPVPVPTSLSPVIQIEDVGVVLGGRRICQHVQLSCPAGGIPRPSLAPMARASLHYSKPF